MEYKIVPNPPPEPYKQPEFHRLSFVSECLEKEDPVRELYLQGVHRKFDEGGLAQLGRPAQIVFLAQLFDLEMVNGGIDQYFTNSSGDYAFETLSALEALEAPISASILREALELLNIDHVAIKDEQRRFDAIDQRNASGEFDKFDDRYYASVQSFPDDPAEPENLWRLCLALMQKHAKAPIDAQLD